MCTEYIKFCFQNLGNGRKRTRKRTRQTSCNLANKKKFNFTKSIEIFFLIVKTNGSLSTSVFIFPTISQILKITLYVFRTQTCRKWIKLFTWTCYFSQVSLALKDFRLILNHIRILEWNLTPFRVRYNCKQLYLTRKGTNRRVRKFEQVE